MTKEDAVSAWVNEFHKVPKEVSELLFKNEKLYEVTPIAKGSHVYVNSCEYDGDAEVVSNRGLDKKGYELLDEDGYELDDHFMVEAYNSATGKYDTYTISEDKLEQTFNSCLPMWGNMWAFGEESDNHWIDSGGLESLAECGFRVYETESYGYVFGIDGMGYSFKEDHFTPLYEARCLRWHTEEVEISDSQEYLEEDTGTYFEVDDEGQEQQYKEIFNPLNNKNKDGLEL